MFHLLPEDIKMKIELEACVLAVKHHYKNVHKELLAEEPLLHSYLDTPIHPDIEYQYADRLPALIGYDSDADETPLAQFRGLLEYNGSYFVTFGS